MGLQGSLTNMLHTNFNYNGNYFKRRLRIMKKLVLADSESGVEFLKFNIEV